MKKRNWTVIGAALATLLVSTGVLAQRELQMLTKMMLAQQEVLLTGQDSSGNTRIVRTDSSGNLIQNSSATTPSGAAAGTHGACTNQSQTVTGTAANVPTAARADRVSLTICGSTAGEVVSCEFDGSDAVLATGQEIGNLDCIVINLAGTVNASCISDGTSTDLRVQECP